jgi:hypothetical protein
VPAAVSVYAYLGARVFRVSEREAPAVRQALDMTASIMGRRPPAVSRRGLVQSASAAVPVADR